MNEFEKFISRFESYNYEKYRNEIRGSKEEEDFLTIRLFNTHLDYNFVCLINECVYNAYHFQITNPTIAHTGNLNWKVELCIIISKNKVSPEFYKKLQEKVTK